MVVLPVAVPEPPESRKWPQRTPTTSATTQMAIQTGVPSERFEPLGAFGVPEVLAVPPLALFFSMVLSAMCSPLESAREARVMNLHLMLGGYIRLAF